MIVAGLILVLTGAATYFISKYTSLGRLPGDIVVNKKDFTFYFPVTTSILVSLILSAVLYFFNRR